MKHPNALVIDVDELEIVERLQHVVAGIVENAGARVIVDGCEEAFERHAVVQIFARMDLVGEIDAFFLERIEDRSPPPGELGKRFFDQPRGTLRPGIQVRPGQRARERGMRLEAQPAARLGGEMELLHGPCLPLGRLAPHRLGREAVECHIVGRVNRDQLALQMG